MRADINYNNIIDGDEFDRAQKAADDSAGLDHTQIDTEQFYVKQHYERYTEENHLVWKTLWEKRWDVLEQQASDTYLSGLRAINLVPDRVPLLFGTAPDPYDPSRTVTGINEYLRPLTGWQSRPVPGYLPAKAFFSCLSRREFPSTVVIRPMDKIDYLPEPDIFHDVFGHVPLHADPVFADFLQTYGKAALLAGPEHEEALARLFWFTVEFGLIRENGKLKVYGSGTISSHAESEYALNAPEGKMGRDAGQIERRPFDMDRVINTPFEIDHFQDIVYVLESFEQLRDAMNDYANRVLEDSNTPAGA
ncbi:MAG: phenylalanine 4-monooxygenase [Phycisphaerales bacterium]|nr:phenylalanine 4-monooxygenase [Phycisphaerales bacterium]